MNEQLMEMLGAGAMAQPTLEERRVEMQKLHDQLKHFEYGAAFPKAPAHEAYSMNTIAQLVEIGALSYRAGRHQAIELTVLGQYEIARLAAVVKEIDVQLAAQKREAEELEAAVAQREAELNAPHPDFASNPHAVGDASYDAHMAATGQDETPPADTYDEGPVEYGDEDGPVRLLPDPPLKGSEHDPNL